MSNFKQPLNICLSSLVVKEWLTKQASSLSHPLDFPIFEVWPSQVVRWCGATGTHTQPAVEGHSGLAIPSEVEAPLPSDPANAPWGTPWAWGNRAQTRAWERSRRHGFNTKLQDALNVHQKEDGRKLGVHNGLLPRASIYWAGAASINMEKSEKANAQWKTQVAQCHRSMDTYGCERVFEDVQERKTSNSGEWIPTDKRDHRAHNELQPEDFFLESDLK